MIRSDIIERLTGAGFLVTQEAVLLCLDSNGASAVVDEVIKNTDGRTVVVTGDRIRTAIEAVAQSQRNAIRPLETVYNGYRFRSRLEARWAVFFDAMKVEWEYEPEGFDLGNGVWYLPDFFLEGLGYAEVKHKFTDEERDKCRRLADLTGHQCLLLEGPPALRFYDKYPHDWAESSNKGNRNGEGIAFFWYHCDHWYGAWGNTEEFKKQIPYAYLESHPDGRVLLNALKIVRATRFDRAEGKELAKVKA